MATYDVSLYFADSSNLPQFPDTWNDIHLENIFVDSNPTFASKYDFWWGLGGAAYMDDGSYDPDSSGSTPAYARAANPNMILGYYCLSFTDMNASHDLAWWQANHPSWILYKSQSLSDPCIYDSNIVLDVTNSDVLDYLVNTYMAPAKDDFDAICIDNFYMYNNFTAKYIYTGSWTQKFSGVNGGRANLSADTAWTAAALGLLEGLQTRLQALSKPLLLVPNMAPAYWYNDTDKIQVLAAIDHFDGVLEEGGFADGGSQPTNFLWVPKMQFIEAVNAAGKAFINIDDWSTIGNRQVNYGLANYMLYKGHKSYEYISTPGGYFSGDHWHDEYDALIGYPTGDRTADSTYVFYREYSNALAVVNSDETSAHNYTIPSGSWEDLYGTPRSGTISLPANVDGTAFPGPGLVLMKV